MAIVTVKQFSLHFYHKIITFTFLKHYDYKL